MSTRGYHRYREERLLPQEQSFQCDMLVWRNALGLAAQDHPGHAALVLRRAVNAGPWHVLGGRALSQSHGVVTPEIRLSDQRYVSFWPGSRGNAGLFGRRNGRFRKDHIDDMEAEMSPNGRARLDSNLTEPREGQIVVGEYDDGQDVWGQLPQATVSVPGLTGARADRLGLSLNRIVGWAARFRQGDEFNYIFASKTNNCSGVAVRAMREGGGDAFAALGGSPAEPSFYLAPNDAQRWANAVRLGVGECNRMLGALRNRTAFMAAPPPGIDLMSLQDWKARSDVAWTIRGRLTAAVDKALKDYHDRGWDAGFQKKLKALVTIVRNVHDHLREDSRRDSAYLLLAWQVVGVVGRLARAGDEPWTPDSYYGDKYTFN